MGERVGETIEANESEASVGHAEHETKNECSLVSVHYQY